VYLSELRRNWRHLLAATIGLSIGYGSSTYVTSLFSPHLIGEFGWSKAQFALLGATMLVAIVGMPIVGRLVDVHGVRRVALIGLVGMPLTYVLLSLSSGVFWHFFAVTFLQVAFVGTTTTSTVYTRLIAESFGNARGLALSIAAVTPAATVAVATPFLAGLIEHHGWRTGYLVLAAASALGGFATFALIPRPRGEAEASRAAPHRTRQSYAAILRNRAFLVILFGMSLCSVTLIAFGSQLKLILLEKGLTSGEATTMISLLAVGVIAGRLASGLALDRFAAHRVAALVLGTPTLGFVLLASGLNEPAPVTGAVLLIGFATGAELDIAAYLLMRHFPIAVYSTAFGILAAAMAIAAAAGSLIQSATLKLTGTFDAFLLAAAALSLIGSASFLLLERAGAGDRQGIRKAA
jgi:MFS family permease